MRAETWVLISMLIGGLMCCSDEAERSSWRRYDGPESQNPRVRGSVSRPQRAWRRPDPRDPHEEPSDERDPDYDVTEDEGAWHEYAQREETADRRGETEGAASSVNLVAEKSAKKHPGGGHSYGGKRDYGATYSLTLTPAAISVVCTVKDPLEHIVWLRTPCPDEYERGEVIARGAVSTLPDIFSVSVSGEDGSFSSTLTILKPRDVMGGGVFRCEAWPHFSEHRRHRRQAESGSGRNETDEEEEEVTEGRQSSRAGRASHDPWNAIILGGAEMVEECFYGSYGGRKYKSLDSTAKNINQDFLQSKLLSESSNQQTYTKQVNEENKVQVNNEHVHFINNQYQKLHVIPTPATLETLQPSQPNVKLYQTYLQQNSPHQTVQSIPQVQNSVYQAAQQQQVIQTQQQLQKQQELQIQQQNQLRLQEQQKQQELQLQHQKEQQIQQQNQLRLQQQENQMRQQQLQQQREQEQNQLRLKQQQQLQQQLLQLQQKQREQHQQSAVQSPQLQSQNYHQPQVTQNTQQVQPSQYNRPPQIPNSVLLSQVSQVSPAQNLNIPQNVQAQNIPQQNNNQQNKLTPEQIQILQNYHAALKAMQINKEKIQYPPNNPYMVQVQPLSSDNSHLVNQHFQTGRSQRRNDEPSPVQAKSGLQITTNMLPIHRPLTARRDTNEETQTVATTTDTPVTKSGLEIRTNMLPFNRQTQSRTIHFTEPSVIKTNDPIASTTV